MSDLLSASSIFLAVISLLYNTWYAEIKSSTEVKGKIGYPLDNKKLVISVSLIKNYRAIPLLLASCILFFSLFPKFIFIVVDTFQYSFTGKLDFFRDYDAVKMLFCIIELATSVLILHLFNKYRELRNKIIELKKDKNL